MGNEKKTAQTQENMVTREEMQKAVSDAASSAAKAAVEALMPAMAAAAKMNQPIVQQGGVPQRSHKPKCKECGQVRETGCKGEHVEMVVYCSRYPEFGEWFPGVSINGKRYLSNHKNHRITVPKEAAGFILQTAQAWEDNERQSRMGRKRSHNSGSLGMNGRATREANIGWR